MSFKIVETIEKGKYVLTTVPKSWENQGNLRWPKLKSEKLRRDPYSTPDDNWRSMSCIVKRINIMSFEEAETELRAVSDVSDTDQEIVTQYMTSKHKNTKTDFNKVARQCFETQALIHRPPPKSLHSVVDSNETILSTNIPRMESEISEYLVLAPAKSNNGKPEAVQPVEIQAYEYRENAPEMENLNSDILVPHTHEEACKELEEQQVLTNTDNLMAATTNITTKLTALETKVENYIACSSKNQVIITLNQEQIMHKLSEISAQFDEYIKRSSTLHSTRTGDLDKRIKIISNEESLNRFEELLKNKQDVDDMTKIYSVVCGEGKGRAINNAYALCDAMFDRKFLKLCSWAGGSRGHTPKICFKTYKRTINFFFKIIHASDEQFIILECESFLKNILRNAKKRCESKQLKRSGQKIRQKKRVLKHKENESPVLADEEVKGPNVTTNKNCAPVNEQITEHPIKDIELANEDDINDDQIIHF